MCRCVGKVFLERSCFAMDCLSQHLRCCFASHMPWLVGVNRRVVTKSRQYAYCSWTAVSAIAVSMALARISCGCCGSASCPVLPVPRPLVKVCLSEPIRSGQQPIVRSETTWRCLSRTACSRERLDPSALEYQLQWTTTTAHQNKSIPSLRNKRPGMTECMKVRVVTCNTLRALPYEQRTYTQMILSKAQTPGAIYNYMQKKKDKLPTCRCPGFEHAYTSRLAILLYCRLSHSVLREPLILRIGFR